MAAQGYALRPVRLTDLPALKRWRSLPHVQAHLRHPIPPTWREHLAWWVRCYTDPERWVRAVTKDGKLCGLGGFYYRTLNVAEVSLLVMDGDREDFLGEMEVMSRLLVPAARAWGLVAVWAEVKGTAPAGRGRVFAWWPWVEKVATSTFYRMTLN